MKTREENEKLYASIEGVMNENACDEREVLYAVRTMLVKKLASLLKNHGGSYDFELDEDMDEDEKPYVNVYSPAEEEDDYMRGIVRRAELNADGSVTLTVRGANESYEDDFDFDDVCLDEMQSVIEWIESDIRYRAELAAEEAAENADPFGPKE